MRKFKVLYWCMFTTNVSDSCGEIGAGEVFPVLIATQTLLPYLYNKHTSITHKPDNKADRFRNRKNYQEIVWQNADKFLFNEIKATVKLQKQNKW